MADQHTQSDLLTDTHTDHFDTWTTKVDKYTTTNLQTDKHTDHCYTWTTKTDKHIDD